MISPRYYVKCANCGEVKYRDRTNCWHCNNELNGRLG